ncbi:glycine betaine ABC transporter substrate-binding protein [Limosilactobacillus sp.]|jgi:osmoprotectant transport system substrate-binding protein|uniref:glycine betaine ABC transporter substrate-binding protein n=1 Tax=Limosilactobacillus sp. TaxID=2773925 RepID=UPI0025C70F32|nr:glycine betaine ABC transporter substrate-binding protein [Limosilactobacillus sp.]MCH3921673.1 glycine/betaine ABC transporter substrate-binding protein [Limosilactobacillus sp.]MCH3928444.1 glycine/betaine ABC transporter substrate-binding protein [Limosilactobacillus sp.]
MNFRRIAGATGLALLSLVVMLGVFETPSSASKQSLIVGSKNGVESRTVGEIYALALEHAGYRVVRKPNVANSVIFSATQKGQVDVYPDYTGTIVETYLKQDGRGKSSVQMAKMAKAGVKKKDLTTFDYAPGDDRQGIGMPTKTARKYHINNLSDLQKKAPQLRFASQGEFEKRVDALPAMENAYGKYRFKSLRDYDASLLYQIMKQGKADAAPVSTTDGQLATKRFTLIKDNKGIWPPYNLVPVANIKATKRCPKMARTLNKVDAKLTNRELTRLNRKVSVDGQNYRMVARNWYRQNMN